MGDWIGGFMAAIDGTQINDGDQIHLSFSSAIKKICETLAVVKRKQRRVFFVGNGGSAGIASHMAADFLKNGRFAAQCFNDPASLTCIANDCGYDKVFSEPLSFFAKDGDVLFAVSSSGQSPNIIAAAKTAIECKSQVITLSGFNANNSLRTLGSINFYVPSHEYGFVECAHQCILHAILDTAIAQRKYQVAAE